MKPHCFRWTIMTNYDLLCSIEKLVNSYHSSVLDLTVSLERLINEKVLKFFRNSLHLKFYKNSQINIYFMGDVCSCRGYSKKHMLSKQKNKIKSLFNMFKITTERAAKQQICYLQTMRREMVFTIKIMIIWSTQSLIKSLFIEKDVFLVYIRPNSLSECQPLRVHLLIRIPSLVIQ